jgi:hypothetical protein
VPQFEVGITSHRKSVIIFLLPENKSGYFSNKLQARSGTAWASLASEFFSDLALELPKNGN